MAPGLLELEKWNGKRKAFFRPFFHNPLDTEGDCWYFLCDLVHYPGGEEEEASPDV
jgi:hypothetical protein